MQLDTCAGIDCRSDNCTDDDELDDDDDDDDDVGAEVLPASVFSNPVGVAVAVVVNPSIDKISTDPTPSPPVAVRKY